MDEADVETDQPPNQPDDAKLKNVLRFLLPKVGTRLGPSPLLSLLSLDWANAEMALGLEFETLWEAELTGSNIIMLFCDCFASYDAPDSIEVDLAVVEDLVILAMQQVESRKKQQLAGRTRLHEIVNTVLKSGHTLDWVPIYKGTLHVYLPPVLMRHSSSATSNKSEALETSRKSMKPKVKRY